MRILLAVPMWRGQIPMETVESLFNLKRGEHEIKLYVPQGFLTFEARNMAVEAAKGFMCDAIFWVDSDMVIPDDALLKLVALLDKYEVASGVYYKRNDNVASPLIYDRISDDIYKFRVVVGTGIQEVDGVGFGCVLTAMTAFDGMPMPFNFKRVAAGYSSEDLFFCNNYIKRGKKIAVDTSIKCGHVGSKIYTEKDWIKFKPCPTAEEAEKILRAFERSDDVKKEIKEV
jgi:glycosyltransferase involved in cell wall biosynthesis